MSAGYTQGPQFRITHAGDRNGRTATGRQGAAWRALRRSIPSQPPGGAGLHNPANAITGDHKNHHLFGHNDDDEITGLSGRNRLNGRDGGGKMRMDGGNGADTFVFTNINKGKMRVRDFDPSQDLLAISDAGGDVVWHNGNQWVRLQGAEPEDITAAHFTDAPLFCSERRCRHGSVLRGLKSRAELNHFPSPLPVPLVWITMPVAGASG